MEKLIELLNESAVFDTIFENEYQVKFRATKIISKELGFIKYLVDNDKINREGMKGHGRLISYCLYIKSWEWDKIKEGVLLMLLAISDKPIYDLISYLK